MSGAEVAICEVGPRDGLQNEARVLPPAVRAELCRRLADAGLPYVQAASFVHPRRVPAMDGAEAVLAELSPELATTWTALVLNERGYDRAIAAGVRSLDYTLAVTETFCERNQGCSRARAETTAARLAARAAQDGVGLTITLAVSFGCPFEGRVPPARTLELAERIAALAPEALVFADTIGVAVPSAVAGMMGAASRFGPPIAGHFHDTRATGIANCVAALDAGCRRLDASVGGAGGCPFAPGATGNVATEDLVYLLDEMGVRTGVSLEAVRAGAAWLAAELGHGLPGAVARAGGFPVAGAATG